MTNEETSTDRALPKGSADAETDAGEGTDRGSRGRHGAESAPRVRKGLPHLFGRRQKSSVTIGEVRYYDGAELSRPLEMPMPVRIAMVVVRVIAALVGATVLGDWFDQLMNEPLRQQELLQENLARDVSYDFPSLAALMPLSDEDMMVALSESEAGYTLYERTPVGTDPDGGFEVIKLPADVTVEEAGAMYAQGINKLTAAEAVRLMKGGWTLTVSRKVGDDARLRDADFDAGTIEKAVQNAMQAEGLENSEVTDSGVDDSGNTYQAGVVSTDYGTFNWRVSVIELKEVYDIAGLPNTAYYVGIRFTSQAE